MLADKYRNNATKKRGNEPLAEKAEIISQCSIGGNRRGEAVAIRLKRPRQCRQPSWQRCNLHAGIVNI